MNKLIINARLNEWEERGPNPHIPYTPDEIAESAAQCREAGVSIVHVHARGPNGEMSHDPATYAEIKRKIKEKSDILIHTTLGNLWNAGSDDKRLAHVLEAKPDIATIDIGSTNNDVYDFDKHEWETTENVYENSVKSCLYFAEKMKELKVKPSVGIWTVAFVRQTVAFLDMGALASPALAMIALCGGGRVAGHHATPEGLQAFFHAFPKDGSLQWCVCTKHANILPVAELAIANGGHVAPGLGDYQYPELDCPTNGELVHRVAQLSRDRGREVATPDAAREILKMN